MIRRILLRLGVVFVTFSIGVSITAVYWLYSLPETIELQPPSSCLSDSFPGISIRIQKPIHPSAYFAGVALSDNAWARQLGAEWYSRHLRAMNELALPSLVDDWESYRFLWLRSFHHPIAVHVWRRGSGLYMVAKQLSGAGGYEPGVLDVQIRRPLTPDEWTTFMTYLVDARYWNMPTSEQMLANDGAQWILEGYRDHYYHVVDRQSPESGAYHDACLYLLRTSGLLKDMPPDQVY